jgi:prepilin-type N-terminal cleavage/methylation domain-containing protein
MNRTPRQSRRGFTLIEAVMSMSIGAVVLGTLVSLVYVAAKAAPSPTSANGVAALAALRLDQLALDVRLATEIDDLTTRSLTLELADRESDGESDAVRYSWSGVSGTALTRAYSSDGVNFATPEECLPSVASLSFIPDIRTIAVTQTVTTPPSGGAVTTPEALLDSYENTSRERANDIKSNESYGQVFVPKLPTGAQSYKVTKFSVRMQRGTSSDNVMLSIRAASGAIPTTAVIVSGTLSRGHGSTSASWRDITVSNCPDLNPSNSYSIAITYASGIEGWQVMGRSRGKAGSALYRSTNGGTSWSKRSGSMIYRVYGTAKIPLAKGNTPSVFNPLPLAIDWLPVVPDLRTALTGAVKISAVGNQITIRTTTLAGLRLRATTTIPGAAAIDQYHPSLNQPSIPDSYTP